MPVASLRSSLGLTQAAGSTYTPSGWPAGIQDGDKVIVLTDSSDETATLTVPGGWAIDNDLVQTTWCVAISHRYHTGDTMPNFVWSSGTAQGDASAWINLSDTVDFATDRASSSVNLVSFSNASHTPSIPGCVVLMFGNRVKTTATNGASFNTPVGFTKQGSLVPTTASAAAVWYYQVQTTATAVGAQAASLSISESFAEPEGGFIVCYQPITTQPIAGAATAGVAATGDISDKVAGGAVVNAAATAAITTAIRAAANATVNVAAAAAFTNWATVTLSGTLYTGTGGILDPNFWVASVPTVGTVIYYDASHITVYADGEISSTTNNTNAVVQFYDGTSWNVGLVVITPGLVSYANSLAAAAGAITTAITMAAAGVALAQSTANIQTGIQLVGNAIVIAAAAASMITGIQLDVNALAGVSASGALSGGQASLQANAAAAVSALGVLSTAIQNAGQAIVTAQVVGALTAGTLLQGAATALAQAAAQITAGIQLAGNANVVASASGSALFTTIFSGAANAVSSALGSLFTMLLFAGNAFVGTSAAGSLTTGVTLEGAAEVDTAAALRPPGNEVAFGYAVITVYSQTGLPVAQSTFLENSACIVNVAYYNALGMPFIPNGVLYNVVDVATDTTIVAPSSIIPNLSNSVTISSTQNTMINATASSEQHQITFKVLDGLGQTSYAAAIFNILRTPGTS